MRKTLEKSVESTEGLIAHQMPDFAQSVVMSVAFTASMFYFDWRLALVCAVLVIVGFAALASMLKSEGSRSLSASCRRFAIASMQGPFVGE